MTVGGDIAKEAEAKPDASFWDTGRGIWYTVWYLSFTRKLEQKYLMRIILRVYKRTRAKFYLLYFPQS